MSVSIGSRLGPYEILAAIGAGGMGEVYRARDSKLGRDVAIKVLPDVFARDIDRMARFRREAKLLAALDHSNIASIYGLETSGDTRALVMQLAEGPTLADRIAHGPLPLDDALEIARQIADAFEYAHEHGIIHRDLKPANIKVAGDETVKVLDFGLAKVLESGSSTAEAGDSPTISQMVTQSGVLLGTAAYMSPEQAKGKSVDRRADVWAFGCVLYEMLTGKKAFAGETVPETLGAILRAEPDWSLLPGATPMQVRLLLRRCLQKDPRQRLRDIGDARISLDELLSGAPEAAPSLAIARPAWRRAVPWAGMAIFAIAAAVLAFVQLRATPSSPPSAVRFEIPMPKGVSPAVGGHFAVSPDGRQLAFFGIGADGVTRLWVRPLASLQARPLLGSETSLGPPFFWSPDSRYIAFDTGGKLKKIAIAGGPAQTICDVAGYVAGGSWNRDGTIIFGQTHGPLVSVPAAGGTVTPLTDPAENGVAQLPFFLPDGQHFVYFRASSSADQEGAYVGSLHLKPEAQSLHRLVATPFAVEYVPASGKGTGHLLFVRAKALLAQAFDPNRLKLSGEPVEIADQIGSFLGRAYFSASDNGVVVYRSGSAGGLGIASQLTWLDPQGKVQGAPATLPEGIVNGMAISPDAHRVALSLTESAPASTASFEVWLHDFQRGTTTRFTFGSAGAGAAIWSPDGKTLMFSSNRRGGQNLYQKPADGSRTAELVLKSTTALLTSWSHDGRFVLYTHQDPKTNKAEVWVLPLKGGGKPFPLLHSNFNETDAEFSPDGHWIAYMSDESGRNDIYVRQFFADEKGGAASAGAKWQISTDGGSEPRWRGDGKKLYYESADNKIIAVDIATSPSFRAGVPKVLFQAPPVASSLGVALNLRQWDVTPDGKRFLFITPGAASAQAPFTVVLNWTVLFKN